MLVKVGWVFFIKQNDKLCAVTIVLVEFITERNVVLTVHSLNAYGISACALPFFCCPENFNIHLKAL